MNFDTRALVHNTEIGVVIESPKIGEDMVTGFWRRFGIGFMGLLPIESQL